MDMQNGYGHAALTWLCSMDMDVHHGHGLAPWTWTCSMQHEELMLSAFQKVNVLSFSKNHRF
jgi:hypothetical protein